MGRIEVGSLLDLGEQPLAELAPWVLPVPVQAGERESSYRYFFGCLRFLNCGCVPTSGRRTACSS